MLRTNQKELLWETAETGGAADFFQDFRGRYPGVVPDGAQPPEERKRAVNALPCFSFFFWRSVDLLRLCLLIGFDLNIRNYEFVVYN